MNYQSKRWRTLREVVLRQEKYLCSECKRYGKNVDADTVHHIFPVEDYPSLAWKRKNLISLCSACHDKMHDRTTHKITAAGRRLQRRSPLYGEKIKNL